MRQTRAKELRKLTRLTALEETKPQTRKRYRNVKRDYSKIESDARHPFMRLLRAKVAVFLVKHKAQKAAEALAPVNDPKNDVEQVVKSA